MKKTIITLVIIIINIVSIIWLFIATSKTNNYSGDLIEFDNIDSISYDDLRGQSKKFYEIERRNLYLYKEYETVLETDVTECYSYYYVDEISSVYIGKVVHENEKLGSFSGIDVLNKKKGRTVNIEEVDGQTIITVFSSNEFILKAMIPQDDYFNYDFEENVENTHFCLSGLKKLDVEYIGVDYMRAIENNMVVINYKIVDDDCELLLGAEGILEFAYEFYNNVYTISNVAFNGVEEKSTKYFVVFHGNGYSFIDVKFSKEIYQYAIIDFDGITEGMTIYE